MSTAKSKVHRSAYIGIDIAKLTFDVAGPGLELHLRNDREGHEELLAAVRAVVKSPHFVCEPCGSYARELITFLFRHRCRLTIANPFKVRQFAKAIGRQAKTDRLDAELLAQAAEALRLPPSRKPRKVESNLLAVIRRREQIVRALMVERQQSPHLPNQMLRRGADNVEAALERERDRLEKVALGLIESRPDLAKKRELVCAVDGVGRVTALKLLAVLPELGRLNRRAVASLAGLAPYNWDSGAKVGVRRVRGGRKSIREALFMAARQATRYNPVLGPYYKKMRARGKPYKVSMAAVMRKLLVHLNALTSGCVPVPKKRKQFRLDSTPIAPGMNEVGTAPQASCEDSDKGVACAGDALGGAVPLQPDACRTNGENPSAAENMWVQSPYVHVRRDRSEAMSIDPEPVGTIPNTPGEGGN